MASTITSAAPTSAYAGQTITVTGTNLDASNVDYFTVGGAPANVATTPPRTATTVGLVVPPGATVGPGQSIIAYKNSASVATLATQTIAAAPSGAPGQSTLARKWALDVRDPLTGAYVRVRGLFDLKPSFDPTLQDDTDYDTDGWMSQVKTMLAWTATPKLRRKLYAAVEDRGQQILRVASVTFGDGGVVDCRMYERIPGGLAYQGYAEVSFVDDGGDPGSLSTASVTLTGKGAPPVIANPNG